MTVAGGVVGKPKTRIIRREREIIERPRLIKKLDACEGRTILLLAPAGYGKTTLARQWAKTLSRAVWVTLTSAHRDVTVLARDLAASIEAIGDEGFASFMDQYLQARDNPQLAAQEIGSVLADAIEQAGVQWLLLDDYHELIETPEAEAMVEVLHDKCRCRFLIATRGRPRWAKTRRVVYGEVDELTQHELAMDQSESAKVVGRRGPRIKELATRAAGWPAVLALAANVEVAELPQSALPETLHRFLAEELVASIPPQLLEALESLALLPFDLHDPKGGRTLVQNAADLGLVLNRGNPELHPLIREFLLSELARSPGHEERVRAAVTQCTAHERWQPAFELIARFRLFDIADATLELAYKPLIRAGQVWTLAWFADLARQGGPTSPIAVVAEAEAALRAGSNQTASDRARAALRLLARDHPLQSRAAAILGHASFMAGDFRLSTAAFARAEKSARDDRDAGEAVFGLALAAKVGEITDRTNAINSLRRRRDRSATDLARYGTVLCHAKRLSNGFAEHDRFDEHLRSLTDVVDPRARTSLHNSVGYVFVLQARYDLARGQADAMRTDIDRFGLGFARPHYDWLMASSAVGLRRFREADRHLRAVELAISDHYVAFLDLNARALRSRMLLQVGRAEDALRLAETVPTEPSNPSMLAEFMSTRAIVLAVIGDREGADECREAAGSLSTAVEARLQSEAARAILSAARGDPGPVNELLTLAQELGTWDPVVCAVRSSRALADAAATLPTARVSLAALYERSRDYALARRAQLRIQVTADPESRLTNRELEILDLMSQGQRTSDIAAALFISEATVKVHARHILQKLGVRNRAEAVAKLRPPRDPDESDDLASEAS